MNALLILLILLIVLMLIVAKKDGLRNLIGLTFNFIAIFVLITLISWGFNAIAVLIVLSVIILAIAIFMSADESEVTLIAFKTSIIVVLSLLILALIIQHFGKFQGFATEDVDELENLSLNVGLNFSNVAIVVMVISMLGAVAESAMALAASLSEVVEQDENMSLDQFKNQREIISQQILGTAVNTLFFGVLGATVGLILWFVRLNYRLADIFNSKLLMAEVAAMLLGMLGILFAIWLSGYFVQKSFEQNNTDR
ncbi:YibE/F family protein [Lactococcus lactis subsp. lactis]|uniref:YibE/F family protein n=1 Tax=Lactococcus lactis TaxID=1358 RepID=UPI001BA701F0|nr:YibE/F family protein [Lactococcus lactis]MBR8672815.1 YibE/F family protein [Lactococcus lactis subsp. lactis]MBR8675631.1 YibE/F family protein [Lactococcus lactis subsp. lactis]MBR8683159.1 YibE/F family protein [Lactococcus lactis subsp. lactis]MCH5427168.1 YibE/F family protein [Lactococcus lactis]MCT0085925.1 YibE/F family protein [Lactococcus lactis subsp. lactis]